MASFTEDSRLVNWLTRRGVQFEYRVNIRFDELQPNWKSVNQGRPDAIPMDDTLIDKYSSAMGDGANFPAGILAGTASGLEVLDGAQRLCSAERIGQTLFNGYVVKTNDPSVRASIRICANSVLNGTSPSQEWTVEKIVDVLYEQHNYSAVDCAQWSGQPVNKIEVEIASRDARRYLKAQGIDMTKKPANNKEFLAELTKLTSLEDRSKLSSVLPDIVRKLQAAQATNSDASHLLAECLDVHKARGSDLAASVRHKAEEVFGRPEIASRMKGKRTMHPVNNVIRSLASLLTTMRSASNENFHADEEQSKELLHLLTEAKGLSKRIVPRESWIKLAERYPEITA